MSFYRINIVVNTDDSDYASVAAKYAPRPGEYHERGHDILDGKHAEARKLLDYLEQNPGKTPFNFRYENHIN
jgi:hypothetical protein